MSNNPGSAEDNQQAEPDDRDELQEEVQDDAVIAVALRRSAYALVAIVVVVAVIWGARGCSGEENIGAEIAADAPRPVQQPGEVKPPSVSFAEIARQAGIDWIHENGATGDRFLPETMGGGAAFFDYDSDGDPDLLLINSRSWDGASVGFSALYENDGRGQFTDRSRETGLNLSIYGTGVAVGDIDNDGYVDLFVAAVGENRLLVNRPGPQGGRVFRDETRNAGVGGEIREWSSSSAFLDCDNDGDLDLFVGNYVRWSKEIDLEVGYTLTGIGRAYGPPINYQGTFPYLYRNRGDGTFEDVSQASGVRIENPATGGPVAKTLGVLPLDADGDGAIDLMVANDTVRNFFLRNMGDGTFEEVGELYGVAYGRNGAATGAMGIDAADYRNDGSLAFAIGNFANEMTSLYVTQGDPSLYADEAIGEGLGAPSRRALTFGVAFVDYDLDGRQDLLQVNGHLESEIGQVDPSQEYRQRAQLFWNSGGAAARTWLEVDPQTLGDLATPIVGRGVASADIDGDGDLDLLLLQTGDRPLLLKNEQETGHHWLRLLLRGNGSSSNRDAIGAWVELDAGGVRQRRFVTPARGYQAHSEPVLTFGLGSVETIDELVVVWPDGARQSRADLSADQLLVWEQGAEAPE